MNAYLKESSLPDKGMRLVVGLQPTSWDRIQKIELKFPTRRK